MKLMRICGMLAVVFAALSGPASAQYTFLRINTNTGAVAPVDFWDELSKFWSSNPALSRVNLGAHGMTNVGSAWMSTLYVDRIVMSNAAITAWDQVPGTNAFSPAPTGTLTLAFQYRDSGVAAGKAVTLHVTAWDNAHLNGYGIWSQSYSINGTLQMDPQYTVANHPRFVGRTWWHAWVDVDGDGIWNHGSNAVPVASEMREPGCLGEHNPQIISAVASNHTIKFILVDRKGATPRFGWPETTRRIYEVQVYKLGPDILIMENGMITNRRFVCEADWSRWPQVAGNPLYGGVVHSNFYGLQYRFSSLTYPYDGSRKATYWTGWNGSIMNDSISGGAPVNVYPANGATVTSSTIEFAWTNSSTMWAGLRFGVHRLPDEVVVYLGKTYIENEHKDGLTRFLMRPETGGPILEPGSNYQWRVRVTPGGYSAGSLDQSYTSLWTTITMGAP